ncbi:MAG: NAD(P)/FAD-dependent oxidoreductase, partial [Nevskiales bacterium]
LDARWPHAFEVRRSEFDELLFRNATKKGANTLEETRVSSVEFQEDDSCIVTAKGPAGVQSWHARYLIDASGRDTFLANKYGLKRKNPKHASAAIFGHFKNVVRRPDENAGNISAYWFEHGWFWMIPLRDGTMSIGAVCDPNYLKTRQVSPAEFLWQTIELAPPEMRERLVDAEAVPEFEVRATGNFSYQCTKMYDKGWMMLGDAFAFIDPIFSSGVLMAMTNACEAADIADAILDGKPGTQRMLRRYQKRVMKGIKTFSWFIERFNSPGLRHLFMNPGNPLRIEEAVTSVLAGDVYGNPRVDWRLLAFKFLYYIASAVEWRDSLNDMRRRSSRANANFTGGTTEQDIA